MYYFYRNTDQIQLLEIEDLDRCVHVKKPVVGKEINHGLRKPNQWAVMFGPNETEHTAHPNNFFVFVTFS